MFETDFVLFWLVSNTIMLAIASVFIDSKKMRLELDKKRLRMVALIFGLAYLLGIVMKLRGYI